MTKAEYWQQHINAWQESGLSQPKYCEKNDIKQNTFYYWRKQLAPLQTKTKKLIPVTIAHSVTARLLLGSQVAIELPADQLPDLLLALRDRGLLYAAS